MALKDILVHVDATVATKARVELACGLAAAHDAHLAALQVVAPIALPAYVSAEIPPATRDLMLRLAKEEAERTEVEIRDIAGKAGVRLEMRTLLGDGAEATIRHARHADLTIVGQGDPDRGALEDDLAERVVMGTGRAVLVIPRYGAYPPPSAHSLVAWNGSREAARAVNDALPLLERSERTTVLTVNQADRPREGGPGLDIALHLARHGLKVEAATTVAADIDVGDALLSRAADYGADLLVMGAYSHSRLREAILGGATLHILRHMTLPVLMSH